MKIFAIGLNYASHNKEMQRTFEAAEPVIFMKPDTALLRNGNPFFLPDFSEIISAKVVFPVPGGPQKIREFRVSFSNIFLMVPFFPVKCSCPRTSSKVFGRSFSAKGMLWFIN